MCGKLALAIDGRGELGINGIARMKGLNGRRILAALLVMLAATGTWVWARSAATVPPASMAILKVDTKHPGNMFEPGAVGLSVDANELGSGHLSANHPGLVRLMRLLGPSLLRIGGTSVDLSWWTSRGERPPRWATNTVTPADLATLRGLLDATGWQVLLGVNLGHFEPGRAADEARVAQRLLGGKLVGIEIGNEPNGYGADTSKVVFRSPSYSVGEYLREAQAYRQALTAAVPGLAVYGPALSQIPWLSQMGASASLFTEITQHYYPANTCIGELSSTTIPPPTDAELLAPAERQSENETLNVLTQVGTLAGRPTLIGETGTGACHGSSSASPAFASALWALDWTLRAASSGVKGLDFHGHFGLCGPNNQSPICASTPEAARAMDVTPQPEYYGMLAATRLEGGRFVPTRLILPAPALNLTSWATLAPGGKITIAIDNLATSGLAQTVSIPMPVRYTATEQLLAGPSVEARNGIALGGAHVTSGGQWRPRPTRLARWGRSFRVVVGPASAIIVTLRRAHSRRR
jgi:hypothetical protein